MLTVAAALGLYAGTLINARDDAGAGAGGSALPHMSGFDGARQQHDAAIDAPADAAPVGPQAWGNIEAAPAPVGPQAWGNIDERGSSDPTSDSASLTAPRPR